MLKQCVVCPYRLGSIKTHFNPCLQCSSELREKQPADSTGKDKDKKEYLKNE